MAADSKGGIPPKKRTGDRALKIRGYPILFDVTRRVAGLPVPVVESVAPSIRLALSEGAPVECRLSHDPAKVLATTADGSLAIVTDGIGIRVCLTIPDTAAGRELRAALASGSLGGSFGWQHRDGATYRWHVGARPWRREILAAMVKELTITRAPAFPGTWLSLTGPEMEAKWRRLDRHHWRKAAGVAPADLTLTLGRGGLVEALGVAVDAIGQAFGVEVAIQREVAELERALIKHPAAKIIDVRYPRSLKSAEETTMRKICPGEHLERPASARYGNPHPVSGARNRPRENSLDGGTPKKSGGSVMEPVRGREIRSPGHPSARETARRLKEFAAELEARIPGASRWIESYQPYVDERGNWQPGAVMRDRPAPLTADAALAITKGRLTRRGR